MQKAHPKLVEQLITYVLELNSFGYIPVTLRKWSLNCGALVDHFSPMIVIAGAEAFTFGFIAAIVATSAIQPTTVANGESCGI